MICGSLNSFMFSEFMFLGQVLADVCDMMGSEPIFSGTQGMNHLQYDLPFESFVTGYGSSNIIFFLGLALVV